MTSEKEIKQFLRTKPGYVKFGATKLAFILGADVQNCEDALKEVRRELKILPGKNKKSFKPRMAGSHKDIFREAFTDKTVREIKPFVIRETKSGKRVLAIGDLHEPFCLDGYLEFCVETYKKYNCNEVVFIGDIIDNHASSYHETDPDGYNAGAELRLAVQRIAKWYKAFPKATVIIGNHDRLIMRKAQTSGLSKMWIKDYAEVLGTPGWNFVESIEIDKVLYIHGEGGTARARIRRDLQSIVQGHLHSQAYVEWIVGAKFRLFGCQTGCGIDNKTYAMAYGKEGPKPAIGCAVILEGEVPFNIMMEL